MATRLPARRSPHDREILRLALPAFGALAAEPLYLLADTAIVGHLGTRPLAGLAIAGIVLTAAFSVFNFLAYSMTAAVSRRIGAGQPREAGQLGVDGLWFAVAAGVALTILGLVAAPWIVDAMGASAPVRPLALTYLRISFLGAPAMLVMFAGAGYCRGLQDTRITLVIAVGANALNLALELCFVLWFDWGIAGSAWGTVLAQFAAGGAYGAVVGRSARRAGAAARPRVEGIRQTAVIGGPLVVRTASLFAVFLAATNISARIGDDDVAAYQIAFQVFFFLAMALDALAIAGQAMIGRFLGATDAEEARAAARRMIEWGIVAGIGAGSVLAAGRSWLVTLFSDEAQVRDLASELLLVVSALQPLNAVVFVLDGVLIGAGDQRFLARSMMIATLGVFAPAAVVVVASGAGVLALWGALACWFAARAVGLAGRYFGPHWQVTGAVRS
jgi:putative MATE family efflux protein